MSQFFTENMFFCELFSLIWFCFEHRPRGLVYSSLHHLGNQKYNSDSQFNCVIRCTDERFLCLFASFVYFCQSQHARGLTSCHTVCPSFDVIGANVERTGIMLHGCHTFYPLYKLYGDYNCKDTLENMDDTDQKPENGQLKVNTGHHKHIEY